ncbi:MAG: DUF4337 domain-containing protein [Planctomycetota bacterium]
MADETKSPEDAAKESFERRSALTIAILAAICAYASLGAGNSNTDTLLSATNAADQWAYFQAKSVKGHTYEVQKDLAEVLLPTSVDEAKRKSFVEHCAKQTERYAKEKDEAKAEAEKSEANVKVSAQKNSNYGVAALILQIAIVITSISILVRKNALYFGGTLIGLAGAAIAGLTAAGIKFTIMLPY